MEGSCSGFADDLFVHQGRDFSDHTAETAKDIILNNASSLDETLAGDRCKQNLRKLEIVPSIRLYGEQRRLTSLVPFGNLLGRARHLGGRDSLNGRNKTEIDYRLKAVMANWAALRGFWFARSPWSHRRLIFLSRIVSAATTGKDACAASPNELNKLDKNICKYIRVFRRANHTTAPPRRVTDVAGPLHRSCTSGRCYQKEQRSQSEESNGDRQ